VKEPTQKPFKLARYIEWTSRGRTGRLAYVPSKRNLPIRGHYGKWPISTIKFATGKL
jgi:hypothetical protein